MSSRPAAGGDTGGVLAAVLGVLSALRRLTAPLRRLVAALVGRAAAASPQGSRAVARVAGLEATTAELRAAVDDATARCERMRVAVDALVEDAVGAPGAAEQLLVRLSTGDGPRWLTFGEREDLYVVRHLARFGVADYEPGTLATILALLDDDGVLFDVGANIGLVSMVVAACRPGIEVAAFEPTPDLAATCRSLAATNGLAVAVHELALGAQDGTLTLYLSGTDTSNSLQQGFREAVGEVRVEVRRLDAWLAASGGRPPTVLKVDTESTEPDVLAGARALVVDHRPFVVVEVLAGRTEQRLQQWCDEHDYRPHHVLADGPVPRDEVVGDDTYQHLNWLLAPGPLPDGFGDRFTAWHERLSAGRVVDLRPPGARAS